jgi:hypothetical protein
MKILSLRNFYRAWLLWQPAAFVLLKWTMLLVRMTVPFCDLFNTTGHKARLLANKACFASGLGVRQIACRSSA